MNEKCLVMLVDDDSLTNKLNTLIIKKQHPDTDIINYTDANAALSYLQMPFVTLPDIIFLDLNMPKISGWDFMTEFNKLNLTIEVVILTSSFDDDDMTKTKEYPAISNFFTKPLSLDSLKNIAFSVFRK